MITITASEAIKQGKRYQFTLNGKVIQMVTSAYVSENENETVDGWLEYAEYIEDENGMPRRDTNGNIVFVPANVELAAELKAFDKIAKEQQLVDYPVYPVEPKITKLEGKIKWQLIK